VHVEQSVSNNRIYHIYTAQLIKLKHLNFIWNFRKLLVRLRCYYHGHLTYNWDIQKDNTTHSLQTLMARQPLCSNKTLNAKWKILETFWAATMGTWSSYS